MKPYCGSCGGLVVRLEANNMVHIKFHVKCYQNFIPGNCNINRRIQLHSNSPHDRELFPKSSRTRPYDKRFVTN